MRAGTPWTLWQTKTQAKRGRRAQEEGLHTGEEDLQSRERTLDRK